MMGEEAKPFKKKVEKGKKKHSRPKIAADEHKKEVISGDTH